jgi:hypothetical protein
MNNLLPMGELELLSDSWCGHSNPGAKSGVVMAYLIRNVSYPGFMDYSVNTIKDSLIHESKKPAVPLFARNAIESILIEYGTKIDDLFWKKTSEFREKKNINIPDAFYDKIEYVYFLLAGNFVKIDKTTGDPSARISTLQTGCPYPISLLAHILGGQTKEFELHRKFSKYRVRKNGEWFHHTGKLAEFISEIAMEELA